MIKLILILILLMLSQLVSFSQSDSIKIDNRFSKYFVDTIEYNQIDFVFTNYTATDYVLWINDYNTDSMTNDNIAKLYFNKLKGDFTLSQLIYEDFTNDIPTELYLTFYKILRRNQVFTISVIIKNDKESIEQLLHIIKRRIVILKQSDSHNLPDFKHLEKLDYKSNSLIMLPEMLRLNNKNN